MNYRLVPGARFGAALQYWTAITGTSAGAPLGEETPSTTKDAWRMP